MCPTCGGTDFSFEHDDSPVRCIGCDRVLTRDELVRENGLQIESAVDEMKKEFIADATRKLRKIRKKLK